MDSFWFGNLYVNVNILTPCNRRCPHCCMGDMVYRNDNPQIFSAEDIARDVKALGAVGTVILTGGEPTLHPDLERVCALAREARGALPMRMVTNGARLAENASVMKYFDRVDMSVFTEKSDADGTTDLNVLVDVQAAAPAGSHFNPYVVLHTREHGKKPCGRETHTLSTLGGRIYGCCVASGIDRAESTELSPGWEERVRSLPLPCDRCVFGME
jgi:hypothetical protein